MLLHLLRNARHHWHFQSESSCLGEPRRQNSHKYYRADGFEAMFSKHNQIGHVGSRQLLRKPLLLKVLRYFLIGVGLLCSTVLNRREQKKYWLMCTSHPFLDSLIHLLLFLNLLVTPLEQLSNSHRNWNE